MRLDLYLNSNYNTGREKAKELIKDGKVLVDGVVIEKPSFIVLDNVVEITEKDFDKYVSRGAYKLLQAMEEFDLSVSGKRCIDVGASTGGFTDVLVQNNAMEIYAIDTGTLQLHERLKSNKKIVSMENTNILEITSDRFGLFDLITVDVSFVSIKKIIPHLKSLANPHADCVFLIKPQFEVGKNKLNKKGIVKNPKDRVYAVKDIIEFCKILGFYNIKTSESKTVGHGGNIEFLLVCKRGE